VRGGRGTKEAAKERFAPPPPPPPSGQWLNWPVFAHIRASIALFYINNDFFAPENKGEKHALKSRPAGTLYNRIYLKFFTSHARTGRTVNPSVRTSSPAGGTGVPPVGSDTPSVWAVVPVVGRDVPVIRATAPSSAAWQNERGNIGPWSEILNAIVP
jgi:hypothetical protein